MNKNVALEQSTIYYLCVKLDNYLLSCEPFWSQIKEGRDVFFLTTAPDPQLYTLTQFPPFRKHGPFEDQSEISPAWGGSRTNIRP